MNCENRINLNMFKDPLSVLMDWTARKLQNPQYINFGRIKDKFGPKNYRG